MPLLPQERKMERKGMKDKNERKIGEKSGLLLWHGVYTHQESYEL